jgi:hypothetical protein
MAYSHGEITDHFAKRENNRDKRGNNVFTGHGNTEIYSYGTHFVLAIADDDRKIIIVNGDRYSVTTARHQSLLRSSLLEYLPKGYRQITIPFSVLYAARVDKYTVTPIDTETDYESAYCKTHDKSFYATQFDTAYMVLMSHKRDNDYECQTHYEHRLGGSVFRAKPLYHEFNQNYKYFLSGFDETHNSRTDGYFISELPHSVKTVADGYESLKPKEVRDAIAAGLDVKRQGDAFAIPVSDLNVRRMTKQKAHLVPKSGWAYRDDEGNVYGTAYPGYSRTNGKPVKWEYGPLGKELEIPTFMIEGRNSHGANEIAVDRYGHVYARGNLMHRPMVRMPEHRNIPLGKTWHRIVFNRAKASWQSTTGRVD